MALSPIINKLAEGAMARLPNAPSLSSIGSNALSNMASKDLGVAGLVQGRNFLRRLSGLKGNEGPTDVSGTPADIESDEQSFIYNKKKYIVPKDYFLTKKNKLFLTVKSDKISFENSDKSKKKETSGEDKAKSEEDKSKSESFLDSFKTLFGKKKEAETTPIDSPVQQRKGFKYAGDSYVYQGNVYTVPEGYVFNQRAGRLVKDTTLNKFIGFAAAGVKLEGMFENYANGLLKKFTVMSGLITKLMYLIEPKKKEDEKKKKKDDGTEKEGMGFIDWLSSFIPIGIKKTFTKIVEWIKRLWRRFKIMLRKLLRRIKKFFKKIIAKIKAFFKPLLDLFKSIGSKLAGYVTKIFQSVKGFILGHIDKLKAFAIDIAKKAAAFVKSLISKVLGLFPKAAEALGKVGAKLAKFAGIGAGAAAAAAAAKTAAVGGTEAAIKISVKTNVLKALGRIFAKAIPFLGFAVGLGLGLLELTKGNVVGAGAEIVGGVGSLVTAIPAAIISIANDVYKDVYGNYPINDVIGGVEGKLLSIKEKVTTALVDAISSDPEYKKEEESSKKRGTPEKMASAGTTGSISPISGEGAAAEGGAAAGGGGAGAGGGTAAGGEAAGSGAAAAGGGGAGAGGGAAAGGEAAGSGAAASGSPETSKETQTATPQTPTGSADEPQLPPGEEQKSTGGTTVIIDNSTTNNVMTKKASAGPPPQDLSPSSNPTDY